MTIYVIIISALIALMGLSRLGQVRRRRKKFPAHTPYVEALHLLMEGQRTEALEKLKKTVKIDTNNILAYIQLGKIYREEGFPIRAAKIHRNLLIRGDLKESEISSILWHLVLDYRASGAVDQAISMAERLVHRDKKNINVKNQLLSLYENKGDWDKAFFYRQSINKWMKKKDQDILALYKVYSGIESTKREAEHKGRIRFREATKLDKHCIPAYLYWGDSYYRENRFEDALRIWNDFTAKNPEWAYLAFDRLKNVYYDLGRYGEIEQVYKQVIKKKPNDSTASINLIEIYRKQGRIDQAIELCDNVLERHPDCVRCNYARIILLQQSGREQESLNTAIHFLETEKTRKAVLQCRNCGYQTETPLWRCPECSSWKTFIEEK